MVSALSEVMKSLILNYDGFHRDSYVPALAVGFDDLQKRVEAQRQQSESHQQRLKVNHCLISSIA